MKIMIAQEKLLRYQETVIKELQSKIEKWFLYKIDEVDKRLLIEEGRITEAYASLASFCDDQYRNIVNYMQSKDFEDKHDRYKNFIE